MTLFFLYYTHKELIMNLSITPFSHSKKYRDTLKMLYKKMIEFRKANPYDGAYG